MNISPAERERGDVLRLVHAKCNYARKHDVIWLRRQFDGTLEPFVPATFDPVALREQQKERFLQWAVAYDKPMSQNLVTAPEMRSEIWHGDISQTGAREVFKELQDEKALIDSDVKAGGRVMQIVSPATVEAVLLAARDLEDKFDIEDEP